MRHRNLNPDVPRLVVDLDSVLGGDVSVVAVDPGARVSGIPQDVVKAGLKPQQLASLSGNALVGRQHGNRIGPHPLIDIHLKSAPHDLGPIINRLQCGIRRGSRWGASAALLGRAALAQGGPAPCSCPARSCRWRP